MEKENLANKLGKYDKSNEHSKRNDYSKSSEKGRERQRKRRETSCKFQFEQGSGWIFGVMGGSVASVTTGTDNLWDELVLDSGSVSTACPYAWCSDISLNNEDKVHLQDIQQRRIPSHGSRVVPLELWGPELRSVHVSVHCDVHAIGHSALRIVKIVREDIRSVP